MSIFDIPGDESADGDHDVDGPDNEAVVIKNEDKNIIYGLYAKFRLYQYHYNAVKIKYKLLSLTWVLATFLGYGYLLSGLEVNLPLNNLLTITLLSCLSTAGVLLLCFLDIAIYHRLLESIFVGAIELEKKFPSLSSTHQNMSRLLTTNGTGPVLYDGVFYACLTSILLFVGDVSLTFHIYQTHSTEAFIIGGIGLLLIAIFEVILIKISKTSSAPHLFKEKLKNL